MTAARQDEWLSGMYEQQARLAEEAIKEVNRLRARVRELEKQIADAPAVAWTLQERVTQLETLLAARQTGASA